jgi:hypothetical protein
MNMSSAKLLLTILIITLAFDLQAQKVDKTTANNVKDAKDEGKEIKEGWTKGTTINVAFNQASLTNWFAGGERYSMGLNSLVKANANYKKAKYLFKSNLETAYGFISSSSSNGILKTDDRWVLTSSLNRKASEYWYYTLAAQVKSQFSDGYDYKDGVRSSVLSTFFAPGDIKLGVGFTYQKTKEFSAYLSPLTAKINLKLDHRFREQTIFGVDSGKTYSFDMGAFVRLDYTKEIKKDLKYTSSFDAFYGYILHNYNFYFSNTLNWKFNKYLGASFGLDIAFDNTQPSFTYAIVNGISTKTVGSPKLQVKQTFGVGLIYSF